MTTTTDLANVPHPAGATDLTEWVDRGTPDAARFSTERAGSSNASIAAS
jgi:hypothetical protein